MLAVARPGQYLPVADNRRGYCPDLVRRGRSDEFAGRTYMMAPDDAEISLLQTWSATRGPKRSLRLPLPHQIVR